MKNQQLVNAALIGLMAAGSLSLGTTALAKADKGLCANANNSCSGKGACGESKGKNDCKGHGAAMITKAQCDKVAKKDPKGDHAHQDRLVLSRQQHRFGQGAAFVGFVAFRRGVAIFQFQTQRDRVQSCVLSSFIAFKACSEPKTFPA